MSNSVLITGASGYIGRNLVSYLNKLGNWQVIQVDRSHGYDLSIPGWSERLPDQEVDYVIHLAQSSQYRSFPKGSWDMFQVNVSSTLELLEWSRCHSIRRFLFASSGNVYKSSSSLLVETDECQPSSMYSATKLSGEYFVQQYSELFETVIMRIFGVYGPGQENMTIPNIIEKIKTNQEITLAEGAGLYFTPLYIDDCVNMLFGLLTYSFKVAHNVFNLSGNEIITLADVVEIIEEKFKVCAKIRLTDDEPKYLQGNSNKLKSFLSYPNLTSFKDAHLKNDYE